MFGYQQTFAVATSREMIPEAHIIVWYVYEAEVISDSLNFFVNGTRLNPVSAATAARPLEKYNFVMKVLLLIENNEFLLSRLIYASTEAKTSRVTLLRSIYSQIRRRT